MLKQSIESWNIETEEIRICVANFVLSVSWNLIWILNKRDFSQWKKIITNIWWAWIVKKPEKIKQIWWKDFSVDWNWNVEARFFLKKDRIMDFLELLQNEKDEIFEIDIIREMIEELCEETFWEQKMPIMDYKELIIKRKILAWEFVNIWKSRRNPWVTNVYIWNYFNIEVDEITLLKLVRSDNVFFLDLNDIERWHTLNWFEIWNNIKSWLRYIK